MSDGRPVAITGLGLVTPLGTGLREVWPRVVAGASGLRVDERYAEVGQPFRLAGRIPDFRPEQHVASRKVLKMMNRMTIVALAAAREAVEHARLARGAPELRDAAIIVATGFPVVAFDELLPAFRAARDGTTCSLSRFGADAYRLISPLWPLRQLVHMPGCHLSIELGVAGPNWTLGCHDSSGAQAIAQAFDLVAGGHADVALCGGVDTRVEPHDALLYDLAGLLTHKDDLPGAVRPFDLGADGFAPAEGSAVLVLEAEEHARARGITADVIVSGVGRSGRAHELGDRDARAHSLATALQQSVAATECVPSIIHASGLAARLLDAAEAEAIGRFSDSLGALPLVTATTAQHGYLGAASAPVAAVLAVQALRTGVIPAIQGLTDPADVRCRFVMDAPARVERSSAVVLSQGIDGDQAAICLTHRSS